MKQWRWVVIMKIREQQWFERLFRRPLFVCILSIAAGVVFQNFVHMTQVLGCSLLYTVTDIVIGATISAHARANNNNTRACQQYQHTCVPTISTHARTNNISTRVCQQHQHTRVTTTSAHARFNKISTRAFQQYQHTRVSTISAHARVNNISTRAPTASDGDIEHEMNLLTSRWRTDWSQPQVTRLCPAVSTANETWPRISCSAQIRWTTDSWSRSIRSLALRVQSAWDWRKISRFAWNHGTERLQLLHSACCRRSRVDVPETNTLDQEDLAV